MGIHDSSCDHEAGQNTVTGGFVWQNDVTGLFPAEFDTVLAHSGGNIRIADWSNFSLDIVIFSPVEETLVGHDGDGNLVEGEEVGENGDDLVAI